MPLYDGLCIFSSVCNHWLVTIATSTTTMDTVAATGVAIHRQLSVFSIGPSGFSFDVDAAFLAAGLCIFRLIPAQQIFDLCYSVSCAYFGCLFNELPAIILSITVYLNIRYCWFKLFCLFWYWYGSGSVRATNGLVLYLNRYYQYWYFKVYIILNRLLIWVDLSVMRVKSEGRGSVGFHSFTGLQRKNDYNQ